MIAGWIKRVAVNLCASLKYIWAELIQAHGRILENLNSDKPSLHLLHTPILIFFNVQQQRTKLSETS